MRHEPYVAVASLERLDGCLVAEQCSDDVAVLGVMLLAHDDPVAIADRRIDHRIAGHLEQEQVAVADELAGEREDCLDLLLGEDRAAGCNTPDERHVCGGRTSKLI